MKWVLGILISAILLILLGLLPWGVPKEQALAAGLLFHVTLYLFVIVTAFIISKSLKISWTYR